MTVRFFYTSYTFLLLALLGFRLLPWLRNGGKRRQATLSHGLFCCFSLYNEEKNVSHCINSLFKCAEKYDGLCEIIVVDDSSSDFTYVIAWAAIQLNRRRYPKVRGKVVRHSTNLGKVEAVKTGLNKALGTLIAVVDGDSWWMPNTLLKLVDHMLLNRKKAVTGYVHPSDGNA